MDITLAVYYSVVFSKTQNVYLCRFDIIKLLAFDARAFITECRDRFTQGSKEFIAMLKNSESR